jgi:isopenicillin-N epimerase
MTSLGTPRRKFLKSITGAALALTAIPSWARVSDPLNRTVGAAESPRLDSARFESSTLRKAASANDEAYWNMVKQQFAVPGKLIMMNAANLCPSPYFIQEEIGEFTGALGKDVSFQYRECFVSFRKEALSLLADYLGVNATEVAITRNTSESNNIIVNGLDLKAGDEIVMWDQNHPTNGIAWEQRAKRYGIVVKKVSVPSAPESEEQLVEPFAKAITSKTKLITVSHISNVSGIALPAKKLGKLARDKGILFHLDGAQSCGFMDVNLRDIGCDFYSASAHKWLMGPIENGILYVKNDAMHKVWPLIIGAGWKEGSTTADEKYAILGQRNDSTAAAMSAIIRFHNQIGKAAVEQRSRYLSAQLHAKINEAMSGCVKFVSPQLPAVSGGIVIIELTGKSSPAVYQKLYSQHGIACAPSGGIRFSPHIYNAVGELDRVVDALKSV